MIKVLADKVLGFHNGEKDSHGNLKVVKTKIGFCELPDWVEKNDFYKKAINDGSLKPFKNFGESEEVLKEQERLQALRDEIKALEEKKELLNTQEEIAKKASRSSKSKE